MSRAPLVALLVALALAVLAGTTDRPPVPRCEEDAVIVGAGDYHGDTDLWDRYECVAADDL